MHKESKHDLYRLPLGRRITGRWRALPDFLIIGAQKAGTTTIYDNLIKHPKVAPADIKEVHYFDNNWQKHENWYRAHFHFEKKLRAAGQITGEASPYYLYHTLVPQRVKQVCPNARFIVVLRNPVERAYSHFHHEKRKKREPLSFEEALQQEHQRLVGEEARIKTGAVSSSFTHQHYSYMDRGNYAKQLENWFTHFPREQFLILESSQLNHNFPETFSRIYDFLGLQDHPLPQPKRSNVGDYDKMAPATREALEHYFKPLNENLFELLGERYDW